MTCDYCRENKKHLFPATNDYGKKLRLCGFCLLDHEIDAMNHFEENLTDADAEVLAWEEK